MTAGRINNGTHIPTHRISVSNRGIDIIIFILFLTLLIITVFFITRATIETFSLYREANKRRKLQLEEETYFTENILNTYS